MTRKKHERNTGLDEDLDKYLNNDTALADDDEGVSKETDELQAYLDKPLLDEDAQQDVEEQQGKAEAPKRDTGDDDDDDEETPSKPNLTPLQNVANQIANPALQRSKQAVDTVSHASTVGGISTLFVVLVVLLLIVVQVDQEGNTRFKMFWYMLNGRAHLDKRVALQAQITKGNNPDPTTQGMAHPNPDGSCPPGYFKANDGTCQSTAGI